MEIVGAFVIGAIAGFVAGVLVGRANRKKVDKIIGKVEDFKDRVG